MKNLLRSWILGLSNEKKMLLSILGNVQNVLKPTISYLDAEGRYMNTEPTGLWFLKKLLLCSLRLFLSFIALIRFRIIRVFRAPSSGKRDRFQIIPIQIIPKWESFTFLILSCKISATSTPSRRSNEIKDCVTCVFYQIN